MASKLAGASPTPATSSPPRSPAAVCCMCGDHGLSRELFRCRVCFFRSQHKYCSNLYPKARSYETCNWCLREDIRSSKLSLEAELFIAGNNISALLLTPVAQRSSGCGNFTAGGGLKLTQRSFTPLLSKPAKKQRLMPAERPQSSGNRKGRQVFRGKVRRYKLLEEVIC